MPKFPSLFRLPRHQQFNIKPRYYDPVKEEIDQRTERIRQEMNGKETGNYEPTRINFKRKTKPAPSASLLQVGIAALLGIMVVGWLQYGGEFFYYMLWVIVPGYLFYRLRTFRKRK